MEFPLSSRVFWDDIKKPLINCLNEGYNHKQLSTTQTCGIINLIYKKGDVCNLSNWRPISLLNVDYKIAAHVLANRLQKIIHKIVNPDQTGYIKGRYIGHNIRLVQDLIDYVDESNESAAIISLDFQKAFDSIEKSFMLAAFAKFGFGRLFIS